MCGKICLKFTMYVDLPKLRRCCFCVPLRHGLLVWAYFKLVWCIFIGTPIILRICKLSSGEIKNYMPDIIILSVYATALVIEFTITIVLIVGAHKKEPKLLRVYYRYGLVTFVILFLLFAVGIGFATYYYLFYMSPLLLEDVIEIATFGAGVLLLNLYLLSLIRSEIWKLENNVQLSFVNHTSDPECFVKYKEIV